MFQHLQISCSCSKNLYLIRFYLIVFTLIFNWMAWEGWAAGKALGSHATQSGLWRKGGVNTRPFFLWAWTWGGLAVPT